MMTFAVRAEANDVCPDKINLLWRYAGKHDSKVWKSREIKGNIKNLKILIGGGGLETSCFVYMN